MPGSLTEITELSTALGMLAPSLAVGLRHRPSRLQHVDARTWQRLVDAHATGEHLDSFASAFDNGAAFLRAADGLRGRRPRIVEWKGPHRPPGDDVIPADIRVDHVYQISCKYLSKITLNAGPARLFERLLVGDERSGGDWFATVAPREYQAYYDAVRHHVGNDLPEYVTAITDRDRTILKEALRPRALPETAQQAWLDLCVAVSARSAEIWKAGLTNPRVQLRMMWKLLRIGDAPYFVLGSDGRDVVRLRVASTWDWVQAYDLRRFVVDAKHAGQPVVTWAATIRQRGTGQVVQVNGHVEVRWSHGRLQGSPEAKVYLDTPHAEIPGFSPLLHREFGDQLAFFR